MSNIVSLTAKDRRIAAACLEQAEILISSAELLLDNQKENVAFSLAILALEELGKRQIFLMNALSRRRDELDVVSESKLDDHIRKLYWSFFGPMILTSKIDEKRLDEMKGLATALHNRRLEVSYVDTKRAPFKKPKNVLNKGEAKQIISLARSQFEIEKLQRPSPLTPELREAVAWFLEATSHEQRRAFISSDVNMDKLREFGNFSEWITWLSAQYQVEEQTFAAMVQADRETVEAGAKEDTPRWRFRIRLDGISHKLKPSELNEWNNKVRWAKLEIVRVKQNQSLAVTITMSDRVPYDAIYLAGRALSERIILALNIGTLGFYWWEYPQHTARFFERLDDLKSEREIVLSESPELKINWNVGTLKSSDLQQVMIMTGKLPFPNDGDAYKPFQIYLDALSFLATINVHRRHEHFAFQALYECFWVALEELGGHGNDRSEQKFLENIAEPFRDDSGVRELYRKGLQLTEPAPIAIEIDLKDIAWMKRFVDAYFLSWASQKLRSDLEKSN